jgi:hypothetical protein
MEGSEECFKSSICYRIEYVRESSNPNGFMEFEIQQFYEIWQKYNGFVKFEFLPVF